MDYLINPSAMTSVFMVPSSVADKHVKLASATQLRVLLYMLKNISSGVEEGDIASFLKIPESEVKDALYFWEQAGVLTAKEKAVQAEPPKKETKAVKTAGVKPSREEIAMLGASDERIVFLLREAELKFGRSLRGSEIQSLVWLYSDHGLDVSVILMLVEYAVSENRATIGFIESTALAWIEAGVDSITAAEEQIEKRNRQKISWSVVEKAFGMEHRMPSTKELTLSETWVNDWGLSREVLRLAYDKCVDAKAKLSMPYVNKILETWHKKGLKTVAEIEADAQKPKTKPAAGFATYDKSLVEQMLNNDD